MNADQVVVVVHVDGTPKPPRWVRVLAVVGYVVTYVLVVGGRR